MSKILRKTAVPFASTAASGQIAQFGSLNAGAPQFSTDPAVIQSLSNWTGGWFNAVENVNSPAIEDMNAVNYVSSYQIAYLMQSGVPEYDSGTTYYLNSFANASGALAVSLANSNLGNSPSASAYWTNLIGPTGSNAAIQIYANNNIQSIARMGVLSAPNLTSIAYVGSLPSSPFATTVLNGSTQEALRVEATSNTAATTRTIGLVVLSNSAAQSYSTELIGIRVQSGAIGASSTVATQIGLAFQGVSGATNNAFISDNEGFSGNYFINSTSTNPSVFSGPMTIGSLNTQQHVLNTKLGTTASGAGTLLNLPSGKSGNPTGFVQMTINGSTAYIPYW